MTDLFSEIMAGVNNEYAGIAEDGIIAGDVDSYFDTGSYVLNALVSGSIYKGFPSNKIIALAGASSVGKSFFCLTTIKYFLKNNINGIAFIFESESALTKQILVDFDIDVKRVMILPVETIQQFRNQAITIANNILKQDKNERRPVLFVLDSLGMLSTSKEISDIEAGSDTRDMTRAQMIRAAFRVLTLKLGKAGIPLLITNHTYTSTASFIPTEEMGGGGGIRFASSIIITITKKKEREGTEHVGNIVHCKMTKGRLTKEGSTVDTLIRFDTGLDRWYGMLTMALDCGIFKKAGNRIELQNGEKVFAKTINSNPTQYFTKEVMDVIDEYCKKKFSYGSGFDSITEMTETEDTNDGNE